MRQSHLLIVNTFVTYARMVLTVGMGLAATRLLMRILGFSDFGLASVLGASGALLAIISDALTSSAQRHMAYEIGRDDRQRLAIIFNTSLVVFVAVAVIVFLVGSALSPIILRALAIPPGRERAAFQVFELTLLNISATAAAVPFVALVDAHQAMVVSALRDCLISALQLAVVLVLLLLPGDKLVNYALLLLLARVGVFAVFAAVVTRVYPGSRPRIDQFRAAELRRIAGFAGWASLGSLAWQLRMQGSIILLNMRFGTIVNSAYAIAAQVAGYQGTLGGAVSVAARSATVNVHARGGGDSLRIMVLLTSKYTCLTMLLFLVPMQIEMPNVLTLWLKVYPPLAPTFARLAMLNLAFVSISCGYHLAALAQGRLARYTLFMSLFDASVLVAGAVEFYLLGMTPVMLLVTSLLATIAQVATQASYVGRSIGLPVAEWLWRLVRPVLMVTASAFLAAGLVHRGMPPGLWRLLAVTITSTLVLVPSAWLLALEPAERCFVKETFAKARVRAAGRFRRQPVSES